MVVEKLVDNGVNKSGSGLFLPGTGAATVMVERAVIKAARRMRSILNLNCLECLGKSEKFFL